ncbi:mismatch-specific DNA-glycosylase [Ruminiclostridium josui]|uniref:mismatch-specific DNA-glycosylase n=1 Tax=Ruminiclostridium josui TaxID=1499 RepID=UPI0004675C56|nr:mismatch-specific DNA-glycosylase [Ruminiclostridium josui]
MDNFYYEKPLPDILAPGLKVVFIGYNPGLLSAKNRHHYSHKSNRFWRFLYESGLTPVRFQPEDDRKILELGYGSTNIVDRQTKAANEISTDEVIEGSANLYRVLDTLKPRIACYVGIGVYRAYASSILKVPASGVNVKPGLQSRSILEDTLDFVCYSTSGLNSVPFEEQRKCFADLKKLLDSIG